MIELNRRELLARATRAAARRWPGAAVADLEPLPGGISSLTFAGRLAGGATARRVAIKVAPPGLPPVRNRDVLRQARILQALHGRPGVRVPEVLFVDDGAPPFFVMEFVAGQAYEPRKDLAVSPPDPATVAGRARAAARMLARLQSLDPVRLGVDEPAIPLTEELARWSRLFATAGDELRHDELEVHRRLADTVPPPIAPCILHGDYRLGNLLFAGDELAAIIDWELWSVGDPRTDLAWLMAWSDPVHRFVAERDPANQAAADAMPPASRLLAAYESVRPAETAQLPWFLAYCYYKLASTMAVLAKRNRRSPNPDPSLELAAATLPDALARARELVARARAPGHAGEGVDR